MMVSPFVQFVARGVEVPVLDKRLKAHVDYLEVVQTVDGSAVSASVAPVEPIADNTSAP